MTYKELNQYMEKNDYLKESQLTAHRLTKYWGEIYELNETQMEDLFELMLYWWKKDENIGNEGHGNRWAYELSIGTSLDDCYEMTWDIDEGDFAILSDYRETSTSN